MALLVPALGACNEEPDFGFGDWQATEDTVTLYSADRIEYQSFPAAYDLPIFTELGGTRTVPVEAPGASGTWDFVLTGGVDGPLTLTPMGAFFDLDNNAGLTTVPNRTFEELERAPSGEDAYVTDAPVELQDGVVYAVRSRRSGNCMTFAKLDPLIIDEDAGTFTFRLTANPNCNDTDLVPPED